MNLVRSFPALAGPLCLFGFVLALPSTSQAAPSWRLFQENGPVVDNLRGQTFGKPTGPGGGTTSPFNPTFPMQPAFPAQPTFPAQPSFPTQPTFPMQPTFPTGQYGLGITGSFVSQGMLVKQVVSGSPAEKAGLQPGDLILKMDGVAITNQQLFNQVLSASGGVIQMVVQRKNQVVQLVVPLTVDGPRILAPYLLGVKGSFGVLGMTISKVFNGTPAQQIGLKIGDQIVSINNVAITSNQQFFQVLHASSGQVSIVVRRNGQLSQTKARLDLCRFGSLGEYSPAGILIDLIHPDTPASRAGLQGGDWILTMGGKVIPNQAAFDNALNFSEGSLNVQAKKALVGVGNLQVDVMNNSLGCWCEPALGGMRLLNAPMGTLSQAVGLNKGDIILFVDNQPTANLNTLQASLEKARGLMTIDYRSVVTGQVLRLNLNLGTLFP